MPISSYMKPRAFAPMVLAVVLALFVAAAWAARPAQAQAQLTLADFDDAGLDVEIAVLIQADDPITNSNLWERVSYRDAGTLLDGGSFGVIPILSAPAHPSDPPDNVGNLVRIRRNANGNIVIYDYGSLALSTYFGSEGAGNDLRIYFQTLDDGAAYTTVSDSGVLGGGNSGYQAFNLNEETRAVTAAISGGERYIFALARPGAPVFAAGTADREVAENQPSGTNVGAVLTAADPQGETVSYSISGSNPAGFTVTAAGQIQTGQELDHETTPSYAITLRAEDPGGAYSSVEVTISVTGVNDAPRFPSGSLDFTLHDNTGGGTNFGGPVTALDQDGDALDYSLGGTDAAAFRIDSSTRQLSVAHSTIIGAAGSSYRFTITARDPSGATATVQVTVSVIAYAPPDLDGPPWRPLNSMLCMGFPGCPNSYVFLFPALAVMGVSGAAWKLSGKKLSDWRPNVYVVLGVWSGAVILTTILVKADYLVALAFLMIPLMIGIIWLTFGGARR